MVNHEEFLSLIKSNEAIIWKFSNIYSMDTDEQKDLYQDIVYQIWRSFPKFNRQSKWSTWMYRIALNTALMHERKKHKIKPTVDLSQVLHISATGANQEEDERIKQMYQQIEQLSKIEKGLVCLYLEGKSYDEISEITGFSNSNVGTRLSRIKAKLKENLINH